MRENHKFLYTRKLITKCKSDLAIKALLYASVLVNCFLLIKVAFKKKNLKIMARLMVTNELTEFCIKQKKPFCIHITYLNVSMLFHLYK